MEKEKSVYTDKALPVVALPLALSQSYKEIKEIIRNFGEENFSFVLGESFTERYEGKNLLQLAVEVKKLDENDKKLVFNHFLRLGKEHISESLLQTTLQQSSDFWYFNQVCQVLAQLEKPNKTQQQVQRYALYLAAELGQKGSVNVLLNSGVHSASIGPNKTYPIHVAGRKGHVEIVKLLEKEKFFTPQRGLLKGIITEVSIPTPLALVDGNGNTVRNIAIINGNRALNEYLSKQNAPFQLKNLLMEFSRLCSGYFGRFQNSIHNLNQDNDNYKNKRFCEGYENVLERINNKIIVSLNKKEGVIELPEFSQQEVDTLRQLAVNQSNNSNVLTLSQFSSEIQVMNLEKTGSMLDCYYLICEAKAQSEGKTFVRPYQ